MNDNKSTKISKIRLFFLTFLIVKVKTVDLDITDPSLFKNEICSYNGVPTIVNNTVICECNVLFVNEPRPTHKKYFLNQTIQCSYRKKKRFGAFFWAALLPMGLDYLYLRRYSDFAITCVVFSLVLINNIIYFILSYKFKKMEAPSKHGFEKKNNNGYGLFFLFKLRAITKSDQKGKIKKCITVFRIINLICSICLIIYWFINIVLEAQGIIKDVDGVETLDNMLYLFVKTEE